ncbi:MAG: hypothetical protein R3Y24_10800 [Eubacteriales bacterium]
MGERSMQFYDYLLKASEQGVLLYKGEQLTTPVELMGMQQVHEDVEYWPDFIVKNEKGETSEIWFPEKPIY